MSSAGALRSTPRTEYGSRWAIRPFLCGHDDLVRSQHVVAVAVALAVDLDDRAARRALHRLLGDRLVAVGVERLALRRVGLDAHARERREQLVLDEADAVGQVVVAVLGLGLR